MGDISIGDLISGGGTLAFAVAVWFEVRTLRQVLGEILDRLVRVEERTRGFLPGVDCTPAQGFERPGTQQ